MNTSLPARERDRAFQFWIFFQIRYLIKVNIDICLFLPWMGGQDTHRAP